MEGGGLLSRTKTKNGLPGVRGAGEGAAADEVRGDAYESEDIDRYDILKCVWLLNFLL